jgi:beta-N-acetylhexosaminidase
MQKAFITGLSGPAITPAERAFLAAERPAGLILFARNCESPGQIRALVADFKAAVATDRVLIAVDQEGGRVQRLRPPIARELPAAARYGAVFERDPRLAVEAAHLVARLTAEELKAHGIDTCCAPVLDVPVPGAHDVIGDRAYGGALDGIVRLGRAVAEGLMAGGVLPVMKHIPGHGRALADSHLELPVVEAPPAVLAATDFVPFAALADLPAAMTAHVVFSGLDPGKPASISSRVTGDIIRARIGFDGLLMSDDLSMRALSGSLGERTVAVLSAGSDLALHCNGDLAEMQAVAAAAPALRGRAAQRFARALSVARTLPGAFDRERAGLLLERLLGAIA